MLRFHVTAVPLHSGQQYSVKQQPPIPIIMRLALIDFTQTPKGIRDNNKIANSDEYKMTVELRFGVPENQKVQLANIVYDAFGSKFNKFYGNKNKVIEFISKSLRNDRTIVALKNGITVGFAGLEYQKKSFIDPDFTQTFHVFGLVSPVAFFIAKLFVLGNQTKPKELHLESIAVSKTERSKGIGRELLKLVLNYAQSEGFSRVVLEVVNTNPRARKLYESFGFEQVTVNKIPYPMSFLVGFGSVTQMVCTL